MIDPPDTAGRGASTPSPQAHLAGGAEEIRPDLAALERIDEEALGPAREQALKAGFAKVQWQLAQVVVALDQDVEGAELHLLVVMSGMERVKVRDAVHAEHHRLAVEHEPLLPDLARRLHDPRVSIGPVDALAVALQPEATTVVFHFVDPVRAVRDGGRSGGKAKLKRRYAPKIGKNDPARERGLGARRAVRLRRFPRPNSGSGASPLRYHRLLQSRAGVFTAPTAATVLLP